ncbi:MAG: hypothetical protein DI585_04135 [Pseudomonas fluorescens]|nr:MAG: hypothetical protein DI585_04135 [Pseudomonas fluorescens]
MITVRCPTCEAAYNLDPAKFPPQGRKLRCARCQTVWFAVPPEGAVAPAPVVDEVAVGTTAPEVGGETAPVAESVVEVAPVETPPVVAPETGDDSYVPPPIIERTPGVDSMTHMGGWRQWLRGGNLWRTGAILMILLGIVAGIGVVLMKMRPDTAPHEAEAAEEAARTLPVAKVVQPPEGVVLHRVRGEVTEIGGTEGGVALTVRGLLANTTDQSVVVPPMRLELLGEDGNVADMWPVSGVSGTLAAHAENAWTVSLSAPDMRAVKGWRVVFVEDVTAPPAAVETPAAEVSATEAQGDEAENGEHAPAEAGHGAAH